MSAAVWVPGLLRLAFNLVAIGLPVAAGAVLALRIARPARPRLCHALVLAAFAAAVVLPLGATFLPLRPAEPRRAGSGVERLPAAVPSVEREALPAARPAGAGPALGLDVAFDRLGGNLLGRAVVAVWLGIALIFLVREGLGHRAVARARRRWRRAPRELERSLSWPEDVALYLDARDGPHATGIFARAVVLPVSLLARFPAPAVEAVARHELAHARWRDPLANAILRAVRGALWVSPALWLLERAARAEREAAADQWAVEAPEPIDRAAAAADFASTLLAVARALRGRGAAAGAFGLLPAHATKTGMLEERVRRLLEPGTPPSAVRRAAAVAAALAGLLALAWVPLVPPPADPGAQARARRLAIAGSSAPGAPARLEAADAIEDLLAHLPGRDWSAGDAAVAAALARLRAPGGVEAVSAALADPDWRVREKLAWTLGALGDPRGVAPLAAARQDPAAPVREAAAWALGQLQEPHAKKKPPKLKPL